MPSAFIPSAWHFQIALTPSALIPSAWQLLLTIASAVPYSLNAFSLNSFSLCSSLLSLGRCPKPYLLFCLDTKKEVKKVKTAPVSLEKWSFGRLKSSNLLKFDDPTAHLKKRGTNFNFGQGRFLTAYLTYFSAHRPRSRVEKSYEMIHESIFF